MTKKLEDLKIEGTLLEKIKDIKLKREDTLNLDYKTTTDYDGCHICDCDLCDCHACDCYYD